MNESEIAVLWCGEGAGNRFLILPGEESVRVYPRVYFMASVPCIFNGSGPVLAAGLVHSFGLDYNTTYALLFESTLTGDVWVFNVHTVLEQEYEDHQVYVLLADLVSAVYNARMQLLVAVIVAIPSGFGLRRARWRRDREPREPEHEEGDSTTIIYGRTIWDILYAARIWLFIPAVLVASYIFFPTQVLNDQAVQWALGLYVVATFWVWWLAKEKVGLVIDSSSISEGWIDVYEPEQRELEFLQSQDDVVPLVSPFGTTVLKGGRFYGGVELATAERTIPVFTKVHSHFELVQNSALIDQIRDLQQLAVRELIVLQRGVESEVNARWMKERMAIRRELGLDLDSGEPSDSVK